jgi:uncharacterized protein
VAELQDGILIIGRDFEVQKIRRFLTYLASELLAIIGRRRVGKTFLVKQVYANEMAFHITGLQDLSRSLQLTNFVTARNKFFIGSSSFAKPKNWLEAFSQIMVLIGKPRKKSGYYFLMNYLG